MEASSYRCASTTLTIESLRHTSQHVSYISHTWHHVVVFTLKAESGWASKDDVRMTVLQGKSSCMPAHAVSPGAGWKVLDCCAAPGNKTTHLAALVGPKGSVIACEKDPSRFETLKQTLARCRASNVMAILGVRNSALSEAVLHTPLRL